MIEKDTGKMPEQMFGEVWNWPPVSRWKESSRHRPCGGFKWRSQGGAKVIQSRMKSQWAKVWRNQSFSNSAPGSQRQLEQDGQMILSSPSLLCWAAGLVLSLTRAPAGNFLVHDPLDKFEPLQDALGRKGTASTRPCRQQKCLHAPYHPLLPQGPHLSGIPRVFWGRWNFY